MQDNDHITQASPRDRTEREAPSPVLSVVIPHLNEPQDLARCLDALEAQRTDGIPFEIIVVDNGSRIPPTDVCAAHPGTRLEVERTPGPGPARNRGAAVANAPLLAFIDCDCIAEPGWVKSIVSFMDAHPEIDFAGGDIRVLCADASRMTSIEAYENVYSYRARLYVERYGFTATGNMTVRARVFRDVGPFGGIDSMEDTEWGQRASRLGHAIGYIHEARVRTPSCKSFRELAKRWDRHVAHAFRQLPNSLVRRSIWAAGSAIVALSPAMELFRLMRSDRLSGIRQRWLAFLCLARVRLYRARLMISLTLKHNAGELTDSWNRS